MKCLPSVANTWVLAMVLAASPAPFLAPQGGVWLCSLRPVTRLCLCHWCPGRWRSLSTRCETLSPVELAQELQGRLGVFCTPAGFSALLVAWLGWR